MVPMAITSSSILFMTIVNHGSHMVPNDSVTHMVPTTPRESVTIRGSPGCQPGHDHQLVTQHVDHVI